MTASLEFAPKIRKWADIFMQRSMREFLVFSRNNGLSMSQMATLFRLKHSKVCDVSDVGEHLGVTNAAASQMVDRLVQFGYVERAEDPEDRRVRQLTLTPRGEAVVEESIAARSKWMEQLADAFTEEQQEDILSALNMLMDAATQIEPSGHFEPSQEVHHRSPANT